MFSHTKYFALVLISLVSVFALAGCESKKVANVDELKLKEKKPARSAQNKMRLMAGDWESETGRNPDRSAPAEGETDSSESDDESSTPEKEADAAETESASGEFTVAVAEGGALTFTAPASWKKVEVSSTFVEYEIAVPKSEGEADDAKDGRLTIMGAGGSVKANVDRWYGQYKQPDGGKTADVATMTESEVAGCKVSWVDLTGTLMDKPGGPRAAGEMVERENYRMLAAIVQGGEHGQYFVKLYGPNKTISDNEAAFKAFVESLKVNDEAKSL